MATCKITYKDKVFSGSTKAEVEEKLVRYVLSQEAAQYSELENKLLPFSANSETNVVNTDGTVNKDELFKFFVADYLNSMSVMNLLYGDSRMMYKDFTDATKRNGTLIAAGSQTGSGLTTVAVIADEGVDFNQADSLHSGRALVATNNSEANYPEIQDGQSYTSVHWYMEKYLPSLAKYPKKVRDAFQKVRAGIPLRKDEEDSLKNNYASFVDRKMVGKSLFNLIKTSTHLQTRDKTSYIDYQGRDKQEVHATLLNLWKKADSAPNPLERQIIIKEIHSYYKPIMGYEYHHQMLSDMELTGTHWVAMKSASKTVSTDVGKYNPDGGFFELTPHQMPDSGILEQVKTDNIKEEIVHATQLQGLVWGEQQDNTKVTTPQGIETTVGKLREAYVSKLAERTLVGLGKKREELFLPNGEVNYELIHERISRGLQSSSPDPQLVKLMSLDTNGKPRYNWNLSVLNKKLQQLLLSYLGRDVLKHVVEGYKYTLVSAKGHNVIYNVNTGEVVPKSVYLKSPSRYENSKDYSTRELKFGVEENGVYYSEAIVPQRVLDKWGLKKGDTISVNGKALHQMGVRIPTQDKHSMVNLRIVDALPSLYENSVILPYEVVFLSGADFDIDSLFARDFYSYKVAGKARAFGSYQDVEQAYNEWLRSSEIERLYRTEVAAMLASDTKLQSLEKELAGLELKELKEYEGKPEALFTETLRLDALPDEIAARKVEIRAEVGEMKVPLENWSKQHGKQVATNVKAYADGNLILVKPLSDEEMNNLLLEAETSLAFNQGNKDTASTKASVKAFDEATEKFKQWGILTEDEATGLYDAYDKAVAQASNDTGKSNIGPAALHNIMFQLLADKKARVSAEASGHFGKYEGYSANLQTTDGQRINDLISTVITGMTDNAKLLVAARFKLTFDQVGPFMHMVSLGMPFTEALLIVRQPVLTIYQELLEDKKRLVKKRGQLERETIQGVNLDSISINAAKILYNELFADKLESSEEETATPDFAEAVKASKEFPINEDSLRELVIQYQNGTIQDPEAYFAYQMYLLGEYSKVKEDSTALMQFSTVISLIKGFKTSFAESRGVDNALGSLGLTPIFQFVAGDKLKPLKQAVETSIEDGKLVAYFDDVSKSGKPRVKFHLEQGFNPETMPQITQAIQEVIQTNPTLFARVAADQILKRDSSQIVIRQTARYADLVSEIEGSLNQFFLLNKEGGAKIEDALITFLNMRAFAHLNTQAGLDKRNAIRQMALFKRMPDGQSVMQYVFSRLKNSPEFKGNKFLNFIRLEDKEILGKYNPLANLVMGKLVGDTRSEYSPEYRQDVANDLTALYRAGQAYTDPYTTESELNQLPGRVQEMTPKQLARFAYDSVYHYAMLVDNMQYRNNGLAKMIDPEILKSKQGGRIGFADALTAIQHFMSEKTAPLSIEGNELKLRGFEDVFGMSRDELVAEFMQLYGRNAANSGEIRYISAPKMHKLVNAVAGGEVIEFSKDSSKSIVQLKVNLNRVATKEAFGDVAKRLRMFGFSYEGERGMRVPQVMKVGAKGSPTRLMHIGEAWAKVNGKSYYFKREAFPGATGDVTLHRIMRYDYQKAEGGKKSGPIEGTGVSVRNFPLLVSGVNYELSEYIVPKGIVGLSLPLAVTEYVAAYVRNLTQSPARGEAVPTEGAISLDLTPVQPAAALMKGLYAKHPTVEIQGLPYFIGKEFMERITNFEKEAGKTFKVQAFRRGDTGETVYRVDPYVPSIDDILKNMLC